MKLFIEGTLKHNEAPIFPLASAAAFRASAASFPGARLLFATSMATAHQAVPSREATSSPGLKKALENRDEAWQAKWSNLHQAYIETWHSHLPEARAILGDAWKTELWSAIGVVEVRSMMFNFSHCRAEPFRGFNDAHFMLIPVNLLQFMLIARFLTMQIRAIPCKDRFVGLQLWREQNCRKGARAAY